MEVKLNETAKAQVANKFELGIEALPSSGDCTAICGGPGEDCLIKGEFPISGCWEEEPEPEQEGG